MNNYKCPQCNLTNWVSDDFCKRCKLPNPYLPQNEQVAALNTFSQNMPAQQFASNQMPMSQVSGSVPINNSPPVPQNYFVQPNTFGSNYEAGNNANQSPNYPPTRNYSPRSQQNPMHGMMNSAQVPGDVLEAEKYVRYAWRAGLVWTILLVIGFLAFSILSKALGASDPRVPAGAMFTVSLVIGGMAVLVGLLSYGVKKKSIVCAILLVIMSGFGLVNGLSEGKLGQILFAFVMITFFGFAIKGISTLNKYK